MVISKSSLPLFLIFIVILSGFGNTVLRMDIESDLTLYRVLSPLLCIGIFFWRPWFVIKASSWFLVFLAYSALLALIYSSDLSQFIPSIVHYAYIFLLVLIMIFYKLVAKDHFEHNYTKLMIYVLVFIFFFLLLEFSIGTTFPNLYEEKSGGMNNLRAFYWNANDLAVIFGGFGWLLFSNNNFKPSFKIAYFSLCMLVMMYNGSKSAIIAFLLIALLSMASFIITRIRFGKLWMYLFCSIAITSISSLFIFLGDSPFTTTQGTYTLQDLFQEPIRRIINLEATGEEWGSLNNRTDASIFVLIEYFRSYGFGLGPGGSWLVLTQPEYLLGGAKSPHNALLQFIVDFGYPILLGYMYLFYKSVRIFVSKRALVLERVRAIAIITFPLLGLSQSGAIVTNYTFITLVIFIIIADKEKYEIFARRLR